MTRFARLGVFGLLHLVPSRREKMVIVYCILIATALMAQVSAQDRLQPLDNPYRVSDIFHSFGQALKGATKKGQSGIQSEQLSGLFTQWLIEIKGKSYM